MSTEKQIEANRLNARKSTGPRTEEGKRQTSHNALSHGLRAESIHVLPHENLADYESRLKALQDEYQPGCEEERLLVEQAAAVSWKITRADRYETYHLAKRGALAAESFLDGDEADFLEAVTLASFDPSNEGERLRRYQFTLNRELRRTLERLAKLRDQRAKMAVEKLREAAGASISIRTGPIGGRGVLQQPANVSSNSQPPRNPFPPTPVDRRNHTNKANFGGSSKGKPAKQLIDIDQVFGPIGVKCTPLDSISCIKS